MSEQPLVSVVVPVYNGERYLGATLESIFDQDYEPLEVIVVDDGSSDGSAAVAQSLSVRYVRQENAGPCAARNAGAELAQGELISFCDADDLWLPEKVTKQVAHIVERPEVGCVLVRSAMFVEPGVDPPPWMSEQEEVTWEAALVWRSVFESIGGFDDAYAPSEGFEWLSRLGDAGFEIGVLPETLAERRIHGSNISYDRKALHQAMFRAVRDRMARKGSELS